MNERFSTNIPLDENERKRFKKAWVDNHGRFWVQTHENNFRDAIEKAQEPDQEVLIDNTGRKYVRPTVRRVTGKNGGVPF